MTTLDERHHADQDDADRYVQRAVRRTSQQAHIHELTTEIERLRAVACDREDTVIEREVTIEQMREHADRETQRREDVAAEYQKAGKSWDATRARLTSERDEARLEVALLKSEVIDFERLFEAKP